MDKRTILAVVLSVAVLLTYQMFFAKPHVPPKAVPTSVQESKQANNDAALKQASPSQSMATPKPAAKQTITKKEEPPRDIKVETENYVAVFSTRGAALKSFQLKKYQKECTKCAKDIYPEITNFMSGVKQPEKEKSNELIELVAVNENMPYPLAITFPESAAEIAADSIYNADATKLDMTTNKTEQRLVFSRTFNGKIKIEKIFTFNPDNYSIALDVKVSNLTDTPLTETPQLNWYEHVDPNQKVDRYSKEGPVAYVSNSIKRKKILDISTDLRLGPDVSWGGFERKYFMAVIIPQDLFSPPSTCPKTAETIFP